MCYWSQTPNSVCLNVASKGNVHLAFLSSRSCFFTTSTGVFLIHLHFIVQPRIWMLFTCISRGFILLWFPHPSGTSSELLGILPVLKSVLWQLGKQGCGSFHYHVSYRSDLRQKPANSKSHTLKFQPFVYRILSSFFLLVAVLQWLYIAGFCKTFLES